jgi:hypothetical protein
LSGYKRGGLSHSGNIFYYSHPIWIEFPKQEDNEFQIGKVILSKVGQQLAPICNSKPIDDFPEYLRTKWKSFGYKLEKSEKQS